MKHIKLFEQFVNEDIKIRKSISEEKANELLDFLKQAIGKKLNWKEFSKWHGGAAQLGKKSPAQKKFLEDNFECEITDVTMRYDADRKYAQIAIVSLQNAKWHTSRNLDLELKLYKDDPNWTPKEGDTKDRALDSGLFRYHWEKQFDRFSDITRIGRFGV